MKKTFVSVATSLALAATLTTGIAGSVFAEDAEKSVFDVEVNAEIPSPEDDDNVITVGVVPTPHGEVLEQVQEKLEEAGWKLELVTFDDYVLPNEALSSGELDANYFQHEPYLDNYNEQHGTDLVGVAAVHFEPLGIYAGKSDDLENIPDGAVFAVPNDTTNEARALLLLEANGIIALKEGVGLEATPLDVVENPHNIEFTELAAEQTAKVIVDVDFAVVNGNYAIEGGIKDKLVAIEDAESEAAQTYANLIVVNAGDEESLKTIALVNAVITDEIRDFINDTYDGGVVAVF